MAPVVAWKLCPILLSSPPTTRAKQLNLTNTFVTRSSLAGNECRIWIWERVASLLYYALAVAWGWLLRHKRQKWRRWRHVLIIISPRRLTSYSFLRRQTIGMYKRPFPPQHGIAKWLGRSSCCCCAAYKNRQEVQRMYLELYLEQKVSPM